MPPVRIAPLLILPATALLVRDAPGLEPLGAQVNGIDGVEDLLLPVDLAFSPDGRHVYSTSQTADAIVAFAADAISTGGLCFQESYRNGDQGIFRTDMEAIILSRPARR